MRKIKELFIKYREIIMYLIMGGLTTVVSWGTYTLFVKVLPISNEDTSILVANILSWICAVLFAYITNKLWVFQSYNWERSFLLLEFGKFVSTRFATGLLEIVGVPLLVRLGLNQKIFGIQGMLSKVIVSILVVLLNYIFSKLFIFKEKEA